MVLLISPPFLPNKVMQSYFLVTKLDYLQCFYTNFYMEATEGWKQQEPCPVKLTRVGLPLSAAVVKNPPNNLWIIAAVLAPIAVVTVIIIIITAVLCRKNKNDFKPDTMMNLPQRAKVSDTALDPKVVFPDEAVTFG